MGVQTGSVSMVALGVGSHPSLRPGVHLRWFVDSELGFPPLGFDVFRRPAASGTGRSLTFAGVAEGDLPISFTHGPTVWRTPPKVATSRITSESTNQGPVNLLRPPRTAGVTCRMAQTERPIHRIEVDIVHWTSPTGLPYQFVAWGVAGEERVAKGSATLTAQNARTPVTVAITGDALDGFQLEGHLAGSAFGISGVRWFPVAGQADLGWGQPLNPRRIGFPVTVPGYLVIHKHGPDKGSGAEDWREAADRLSPSGVAAGLPAPLAQRFGPPVFAGTRQVLRDALARRPLITPGSGATAPRITLDTVRLVLLGALDPDFARLAGLGLVDGTAGPGLRYDYKLVGYWPGRLRPQPVCVDVPSGGGQLPSGGTITLSGPGGGTVVTAGSALDPPSHEVTLGVTGVAGLAWSPDGQKILAWGGGGAWVADASGAAITALDHNSGTGAVLGAAWNPAQDQVLTWAADQTVRLWAAATGHLVRAMRHSGAVREAAWSPNGRQLLTVAENGPGRGEVHLWGPVGDDPLIRWPVTGCLGAAWSPEGLRVLTWARTGRVQVWTAEQAVEVWSAIHRSSPLGAAWSPDGRQMLSWAEDGAVWVSATEGPANPLVLRHPPGSPKPAGAAWGADGRLIVTWGAGGPARVWHVDRGTEVTTLAHEAGVAGAAWSPDGRQMLTWDGAGAARTWEIKGTTQGATQPQVLAGADLVVDAAWSVDGRRVVVRSDQGTAQVWVVRDRVRSLTFALPAATDQIRVTGHSAGPEPLTVRASSGSQVVRVQTAPPGPVTTVTVEAPGITTVTVTGNQLTVVQVCRLELVREPDQQEVWICFDVAPGPVPPLAPPVEPRATVLPGFARDGGAEQLVGLVFEPPPRPDARVPVLFPLARSVHDPVAYEVRRRADGAQPVADPATGPWLDLVADPASGQPRWVDLVAQPLAGHPEPQVRSSVRPPLHTSPAGWPAGPQDLLDGRVDPAVRHYSYRVHGRDLFGRFSDWSAPVTVDSADRIAPPAPGALTARWLDRADPWLALDDLAELDAAGAQSGVLVRWSWPASRRQQAPDTVAFRLYWHDRPLTTLLSTITADPQVTPTTYAVSVAFGLGVPPPVDAFRGDWLRQGNRQYLVLASSATDPTTLTLSAKGVEPPTRGPCSVSLRAPDPQRLDLLGNPLRPDPARAVTWVRRARQGPLVTLDSMIVGRTPGVAVTCQQVRADIPRPDVATVLLNPDWHWSGQLPDPAELTVGTAAPWRVLGWTLGRATVLLVDTAQRATPPVGPAVLRAADAHTLTLAAAMPAATPFAVVGGTVAAESTTLDVLAHAAGPLRLVVAQATGAGHLTWFPDHQVVLPDVTLAVSDTNPQAVGHVGVSAVDGRPWTADQRAKPSEPGGPGNEGPVASVAVRREYRAAPTAGATPAGTTGPDELWAPVPDEFSGRCRFPLRWPAAGSTRFQVDHASLDAVLDADLADRAARRGAYVGLPALDAAGLTQWRAQQAALGPVGLQQLATGQAAAFLPLTPSPLSATDPLLADPQPGWLRWPAPLDGSAPGRHFLRIRVVDAAGNTGPPGPATLPIVIPNARRPRPPQLRRAIGSDRAVWLHWGASDGGVAEYRVYRARLATGATPDVRDMTLVATLPDDRCPETVTVLGGEARLPGSHPVGLVALYRADDYDPGLAPDAQTGGPIAGATLSDNTVGGLDDLPDGTLVYGVVRYAPGDQPKLAVSATGRAYRDAPIGADVPYQYRVVAVREAATGPTTTLSVASFASEVLEAVPFDARPPVPPDGAAAWDATATSVKLTWPTAGLAAGLEVLPQRMDVELEEWVGAARWMPGATGSVLDANVLPGRSYLYRLRVRVGDRMSEAEPTFGPVTVP